MTIFGLNLSNNIFGLLILGGIVAAFLLVYMLFRILNEQESIFKEIRNGTKNLIESGEKLHNMYSLAESLIEKINDVRFSDSSQSISEVDFIAQDLLTKNFNKFENIASEIKKLIQTMNMSSADELPRWLNDNGSMVNKLIAEQKMLAPDIVKLQKSLDQILLSLKRNLSYENIDLK